MKKVFTFLFIILSGMHSAAQFCNPADTSFGIGGRASNTILSNNYLNSVALFIQPDGKILQVGTAYTGSLNSLFMQRFNADGSPDQGFGNAGAVLNPLPYNGVVTAAALQPDGKILLAGNDYVNNDFFLLRFNGNGSRDTALKSRINITGKGFSAESIAVQDDGKILVMGTVLDSANLCNMENYFYPKVAVVRVNSNGNIDSSFGKNGKIVFGTGQFYDYGRTITLQPDGKILVGSTAGYKCDCAPGYYGGLEWICEKSFFLMQRLNNDGSLDKTFGIEGKVADSTFLTNPSGLILQPDGKILISGSGSLNVITKRYNSDGSPDLNFGSGGKNIIYPDYNFDYMDLKALTIQADGRIILAVNYLSNNGNVNATLARLNVNGSIDSTFGLNGKTSSIFGPANYKDYITSAAMQGESIIVGGQSNNNANIFAVRLRKKIPDFVPAITAIGPTSFCFGDSVNLSSDLTGNSQWYNFGVIINGATKTNYTAKVSGSYQVQINTNNGCGISGPLGITVFPLPNSFFVNWDGTKLSADAGFSQYQWYRNGEMISGATGQSYSPGSNIGLFKVRVTDSRGCSNFSSEFNMVVTDVADITIGDSKLRYYPNPSSSVLYIDLSRQSINKLSAEIYDMSGKLVRSQNLQPGHNEIPLMGINSGMYGLVINSGKEKTVRKIVVAK